MHKLNLLFEMIEHTTIARLSLQQPLASFNPVCAVDCFRGSARPERKAQVRFNRRYPRNQVPGLGDEAYFDPRHAIQARKGKVRFFLSFNDEPTAEKPLKDLASRVAARL
jgi:hypothetical protein